MSGHSVIAEWWRNASISDRDEALRGNLHGTPFSYMALRQWVIRTWSEAVPQDNHGFDGQDQRIEKLELERNNREFDKQRRRIEELERELEVCQVEKQSHYSDCTQARRELREVREAFKDTLNTIGNLTAALDTLTGVPGTR